MQRTALGVRATRSRIASNCCARSWVTPSENFTEQCWEASKPFFELVGESDSSTAGGDVTVTVTGDTAVASYVDSDGKQQSEKWRLVGGDWLVDCP